MADLLTRRVTPERLPREALFSLGRDEVVLSSFKAIAEWRTLLKGRSIELG
jgi:hypothetical protein